MSMLKYLPRMNFPFFGSGKAAVCIKLPSMCVFRGDDRGQRVCASTSELTHISVDLGLGLDILRVIDLVDIAAQDFNENHHSHMLMLMLCYD